MSGTSPDSSVIDLTLSSDDEEEAIRSSFLIASGSNVKLEETETPLSKQNNKNQDKAKYRREEEESSDEEEGETPPIINAHVKQRQRVPSLTPTSEGILISPC